MNKYHTTQNFTLIELEEQECNVYDIETDTHNFFGNDILVHNSIYTSISNFTEAKGIKEKYILWDRNKKLDFLDYVCRNIESKVIEPCFKTLGKDLNLKSFDNLVMKREVIAAGVNEAQKSGFWAAKKHYMLLVDDNEGLRYSSPHIKVMGLPFIQTIYAEFFRKHMKSTCEILIQKGAKEARDYIKKVQELVKHEKIANLSLIRGVTDVTGYTGDDGLPTKGTGIHAKAAIYYNFLIKKLNLENKYPLIKDGMKLRFIYLKPNAYKFNVIGFIDELVPEFRLEEFIDYDTTIEKSFLKPLRDIFESCGLDFEEKFDMNSLFG